MWAEGAGTVNSRGHGRDGLEAPGTVRARVVLLKHLWEAPIRLGVPFAVFLDAPLIAERTTNPSRVFAHNVFSDLVITTSDEGAHANSDLVKVACVEARRSIDDDWTMVRVVVSYCTDKERAVQVNAL